MLCRSGIALLAFVVAARADKQVCDADTAGGCQADTADTDEDASSLLQAGARKTATPHEANADVDNETDLSELEALDGGLAEHSPVLTQDSTNAHCYDMGGTSTCSNSKMRGDCTGWWAKRYCKKTCGICGGCVDYHAGCERFKAQGRCSYEKETCPKTCGVCQ